MGSAYSLPTNSTLSGHASQTIIHWPGESLRCSSIPIFFFEGYSKRPPVDSVLPSLHRFVHLVSHLLGPAIFSFLFCVFLTCLLTVQRLCACHQCVCVCVSVSASVCVRLYVCMRGLMAVQWLCVCHVRYVYIDRDICIYTHIYICMHDSCAVVVCAPSVVRTNKQRFIYIFICALMNGHMNTHMRLCRNTHTSIHAHQVPLGVYLCVSLQDSKIYSHVCLFMDICIYIDECVNIQYTHTQIYAHTHTNSVSPCQSF